MVRNISNMENVIDVVPCLFRGQVKAHRRSIGNGSIINTHLIMEGKGQDEGCSVYE